MKCARDFRFEARNALRGKWIIAVLAGFIAFLLGGEILGTASTVSITYESSSQEMEDYTETFNDAIEQVPPETLAIYAAIAITMVFSTLLLALGIVIAFQLISGPLSLGYAKYNLSLIDRKPGGIGDLFSQFGRLKDGFLMRLLMIVYTLLWTLLFIIPGIIKSYSYALTTYILYEHPEMSANEAITESRRLMHGNKWRLFCLHLSFIGWQSLCILPPVVIATIFGLGNLSNPVLGLWVGFWTFVFGLGLHVIRPYREAAFAAFYRELCPAVAEVENAPAIEGERFETSD